MIELWAIVNNETGELVTRYGRRPYIYHNKSRARATMTSLFRKSGYILVRFVPEGTGP